jgi:hypothetical protein
MSAVQDQRWDDDEEEQSTPDNSAIRDLRKAYNAKDKRVRELEEQLAGLSKSSRDRSLKEVLQARGLNPKVAALVPSDVEPTEEAIGKWLDDYGDVFGLPGQEQKTAVDEVTVGQLRQMDAVGQALNGPQSMDLAGRIASVNSKEELDALIFGGGAGR